MASPPRGFPAMVQRPPVPQATPFMAMPPPNLAPPPPPMPGSLSPLYIPECTMGYYCYCSTFALGEGGGSILETTGMVT